jgi:hypothetical protein
MKFREMSKRAIFGVAAAATIGTIAVGGAANAFADPTPPQPGSHAYCTDGPGGYPSNVCTYYGDQPWAYSTG